MAAWSTADYEYMSRAIRLAREGQYTTQPNPRVGCVLVKENVIVGEGFHFRAGQGHAEVNAIAQAAEQACGATAYVTLEPCSHQGKTPPCAEALITAGVCRVVAAMVDPNPSVSGRGIELLQIAGIHAEAGLLESEARDLNPGFIKRMEQGLPYVRVKMATSLDGRTAMASGESQWITGPAARSDVQKLRAKSSAVLTGIDSILQDDSSLTLRKEQLKLDNADEIVKQQPLRVVLDTHLRMPIDAKILQQAGRTVVMTCATDQQRSQALVNAGAELIVMPESNGQIALRPVLEWLAAEEECNELLIETGATLAGSFLQEGLVDEIQLYMAMTLLGSEAKPAFAMPLTKMSEQIRMDLLDQRMLGSDLKLTLRPVYEEQH